MTTTAPSATPARRAACPLLYDLPFTPPRQRAMPPEAKHRLEAWCEELFPGTPVDIAEWVGTDCRRAVHAVAVAFKRDDRPQLELFLKSEDVRRHHLARAGTRTSVLPVTVP